MVEFTLIVPILLVVVFAVIQFGVAFNDYLNITDATRAGARKAVVSRHASCPECQAEAAVRNSASDLKGDLRVSVAASNWQKGGDVAVTASYPYEINLLGMVVKSGRLTSTTTERIE